MKFLCVDYSNFFGHRFQSLESDIGIHLFLNSAKEKYMVISKIFINFLGYKDFLLPEICVSDSNLMKIQNNVT